MKKADPRIIAKKYATALFLRAKELGKTDEIYHDFLAIHQMFEKIKIDFNYFSTNQWNEIIKELSGKISDELIRFFHLLIQLRRISLLPYIFEEFQKFSDLDHNVSRGTLYTVEEIELEQILKMQDIVTKKIGKKVIFDHKKDPKILGGIVAEVDGWTFDDSLRTHLNKLTQVMSN